MSKRIIPPIAYHPLSNAAADDGFGFRHRIPCKHKTTPVFTFGEYSFHGRAAADSYSVAGGLAITLAATNIQPLMKFRGMGVPQELVAHTVAMPVVEINWPDRDPFPGTFEAVQDIFQWIVTQPLKKIYINCVGGHGRTGTLLAIFYLCANPKSKGLDVIDTIRMRHCPNAIETKAQEYQILAFANYLQGEGK